MGNIATSFNCATLLLKGSQGQLYSWLDIAPKDKFSKTADFLYKSNHFNSNRDISLALSGPRGSDQQVQKVGKVRKQLWLLTVA